MKSDKSITAVVLAGGRGSRMGGEDKGLILFDDKPLIQHIINGIAPQTSDLLINANRNIDKYKRLGFPVVQDEIKGYQGPLAGFLSSLNAIQTIDAIFVPCDGPLLSRQLVSRLYDARCKTDAEIAVAHDGKRLQPIYALIPARLKMSLSKFLESGERKIDRWYAHHHTVEVDFSDLAETFININTPEDLGQLGNDRTAA